MVIARFSRLKECGVFRDYSWPNDLPDFSRYNLVYGWNGSGKSTLSGLLRSLELRSTPAMGQVRIRIEQNDIVGNEFPQVTHAVRVFNRDFVNESVFPVNGGDVAPIFVIGKESVDKQKEADGLKVERKSAERSLQDARAKKQEAGRAFDSYCVEHAKVVKEALRSSGSNPYNNYDKASFRRDAQGMADDNSATNHALTNSERDALRSQCVSAPKPKMQEITCHFPPVRELADSVDELLGVTVVSSAIQSLKNDSVLAEWTRHGLGLHKARKTDQCLFCEQPLPESRLAQLEAHFSTEYERFLQRINERIRQLEGTSKQVTQLGLPNRAEFYDEFVTDYDAARVALEEATSAFRNFVGEIIDALNTKRSQPFKALSLDVAVPVIAVEAVGELNVLIRKHSQACDDFQSRVTEARKCLANDTIASGIADFIKYRDAAQAAQAAIDPAQQEVYRLTSKIERLEREIVEHRQPAEELNEDLRKYLGHDELQFAVKSNGYTITRGGEPASGLSEGEKTAIALLHFLKSLKDRRFDLAKGVVVLDDPVSSLDANALFLAFGFIRERTNDAAEVLILTHNFAFFRQVRNWFHHLKGQNKKNIAQRPARFYMLDCMLDGGRRCSSIQPLDPLLEQYESEYHYLFARIYRAASAPAAAGLEDSYIFPNMARRLLESFLAFRQPATSGELQQKMMNAEFDQAKKLRILRFLHTHSHSDAVGAPEHDLSLLGETGAVLKDLLDFIKVQDEAHFDAMVKLVDPSPEEETDE